MFREEAEKLESGEPSDDDSKMKDLQTDISKVPCIIDPDSTRMRNWDIYIMLLLVFTAAVTPYEVGTHVIHDVACAS